MRGVSIDPAARTARVEAGALWMDVVPVAYEHGLTALSGSAPDVGVVGYTLGGGLSWHGRSLGLAANHVTAIEVVTADGLHRRVDADHDPELFWALRGGGGSFARRHGAGVPAVRVHVGARRRPVLPDRARG